MVMARRSPLYKEILVDISGLWWNPPNIGGRSPVKYKLKIGAFDFR